MVQHGEKENKTTQILAQYLENWDAYNKSSSTVDFRIQMRHCKLSRCYDKESRKLTICVDRGEVYEASRRALLATGATLFEGAAPLSNLERELQRQLK